MFLLNIITDHMLIVSKKGWVTWKDALYALLVACNDCSHYLLVVCLGGVCCREIIYWTLTMVENALKMLKPLFTHSTFKSFM